MRWGYLKYPPIDTSLLIFMRLMLPVIWTILQSGLGNFLVSLYFLNSKLQMTFLLSFFVSNPHRQWQSNINSFVDLKTISLWSFGSKVHMERCPCRHTGAKQCTEVSSVPNIEMINLNYRAIKVRKYSHVTVNFPSVRKLLILSPQNCPQSGPRWRWRWGTRRCWRAISGRVVHGYRWFPGAVHPLQDRS